MSFAVNASAPRFNLEALAPPTGVDGFDPTFPVKVGNHDARAGLLSNVAGYDWCGTKVPHFPFPLPPKGGDDGGWCGTVPRPLPGPIPPTPQPWLDLANAAQSFR